MRRFLKERALEHGEDVEVILAGLSNIYTSYITTPEEYMVQRYEGASTIYGPHTLTIYLEKYVQLLSALLEGHEVEAGPNPPNLDSAQINLNTPVKQQQEKENYDEKQLIKFENFLRLSMMVIRLEETTVFVWPNHLQHFHLEKQFTRDSNRATPETITCWKVLSSSLRNSRKLANGKLLQLTLTGKPDLYGNEPMVS